MYTSSFLRVQRYTERVGELKGLSGTMEEGMNKSATVLSVTVVFVITREQSG